MVSAVIPTRLALTTRLQYELVRSSDVLRGLGPLLKTLEMRNMDGAAHPSRTQLASIITVVEYYEQEITKSESRSAKDAFHLVAQRIDVDGLFGVRSLPESEPPRQSQDVLGFSRFACQDGLALMP